MKKIINALLGESKSDSTAKKAVVYAILVTTAILILTVITLIVSSILFSQKDDGDVSPPNDASNNGGSSSSVTLEYETVSADDLKKKIDGATNVKNNRSKLDDGIYYATANGEITLFKSPQKALDEMLVAFFNSNKQNMIADPENSECNVPLVGNSDGAYKFDIDTFAEESIENKPLYSWIYSNAHTYGFIYEGNTFRYVGIASATYMKSNNITSYSSYVDLLKGSSSNISVNASSSDCQIYYLASDSELKIPKSYDYSVISDGTKGYIITVNLSSPTVK